MMKRRLTVAEERELKEEKYIEMLHNGKEIDQIFTRPPYSIPNKIHSAK